MTPEKSLAAFVYGTSYDALPGPVVTTVKNILLTTLGTGVAGAGEDGCQEVRQLVASWGGAPQATVMVYGDRVPAPQAAFLNGVMCRALDYCDAMAPGLHIGSSLMPAALAAAELQGGCTGRAFLTALAVGAEVGARMNLTERAYGGLDPTGIAGVFASTAAAARLLGLGPEQTHNALALAFNRAGGSFQSNVDGSLAVRLIQGWVAETGVTCALLAQRGLTGPRHFLSGVYGYAALYAKGERDAQSFADGLGREFRVLDTMFKKYPSCGLTQGATELAVQAAAALRLTAGTIGAVRVRIPPYAFRLVGHAFAIGDNPRVNAQFSIQYCIANALLGGASTLADFRPASVHRTAVVALASRVEVTADPAMDARGHTAVDLHVATTDGRVFDAGLDIAPGFPGNALDQAEHARRFRDCMNYAQVKLPRGRAEEVVDAVEGLEAMRDVRRLVELVQAGASEPRPTPAPERVHA